MQASRLLKKERKGHSFGAMSVKQIPLTGKDYKKKNIHYSTIKGVDFQARSGHNRRQKKEKLIKMKTVSTLCVPSPLNPPKPGYALFASGWAIGTVVILILIKAYAYMASGSAAVLATLTDSITDAAISLSMFAALRYALKPADTSHRYGHGKMEGIAAFLQSFFLGGAGIFLCFEASNRLTDPTPVESPFIGIAVAMIAMVLSLLLVRVQTFCLKKAPSLAIEADHAHYKTDIALNAGVALSLTLSFYGAPAWVDPAFAAMIGLYYILTGFKIGIKSLDMLMDRELPDAVRARLETIISHHPDILGFHDLRTRASGMKIHISLDVEIAPDLSLQKAHDIARALEEDMLKDYPHAEILIHKDPYGDPADSRHIHLAKEK